VKILKKLSILFVTLMLLSSILSACTGEQKPTSNMLSNATSSAVPPETTVTSPENKAAHAAYESALKANSGPLSIFREIKTPYAYYDIDGNGIDELIVYPGTGAGSYAIFTYAHGQIYQLVTIGQCFYEIQIYPKTRVVFLPNGHMGYYYDSYYQIESTKAVKVAEKSMVQIGDSLNTKNTYCVAGKQVSAETYETYIKALKQGPVVYHCDLDWH